MALHTLKQSQHALIKGTEYQVDNLLVYAVYAKNRIIFFVNSLNIC